MSKNKSLLRSSSGPCYPYPRSHSTVMVVPSVRALPTEDQEKKKPQPKRRPPLNRAIPPIPESKSNESIMSHASRVSADPTATTATTDCVIIENRSAVERLPPVKHRDDVGMRRHEVKEKTTPRSPLLSVAHTMREKLSKLTRRKSPGVKNSQSFSGFRGAPPPPSTVDENSNRVIKSSSMEASLISERPSTSKVVIPQLPEPLCSDELSETSDLPSTDPVVRVSMKADLLTVTEVTKMEQPAVPEETPVLQTDRKEEISEATNTGHCTTTVIVTERPRELPVTVVYQPEVVEVKKEVTVTEIKKEENKENSWPETKNVTTVISITTKKVEDIRPRKSSSPTKSKSPERYVMTVKTPEAQRKHRAFVVGERPPEPIVEELIEQRHVEEIKTEPISRREETKSPEKYILTVKSPEPQRKHRVFLVGAKSFDAETVVEEKKSTKLKKSKTMESRESSKSPERYILSVKTPETLRKHRVLTIMDCPEKKITRSRSEERQPLKIWTSLRKSLALRRTQTFSNADLSQRTPSEEKKSRSSSAEKRKKEDEEKLKEKFIIVVKTPQILRRHHTFMVGERSRTPDMPWIEEGEITEPIATIGPSAQRAQKLKEKRTRSEEPRRDKEDIPERFIMTARTPLAMRKYQTFIVEPKEKKSMPTSMSADVGEVKRRGDELLRELDAIYPTSSKMDSREFSSSKELSLFSQESPHRMTMNEMYSITTTTPQLRRREDVASPTLFILNKRSERPLDERLEAVKEVSHSDKAELRSPSMDDLTSLEDDLPMDTSTDEKVRPVVNVLPLQSRPVVSPKTTRKKKKVTLGSRSGQSQSQRAADHRLLRGLRTAGRLFSPGFLNKKRPAPVSSTLPRTVLHTEISDIRAPLAQVESSVVANSPLVENLPIEAWNTPRPRCPPPRAFAALIREEVHDANGNPQEQCPSSPQLLHPGLIDDEILDQPMLVGDSFSHSESSDHLSERAMPEQQQQRRADVAPTQHIPPVIQNDTFFDQGLVQVQDLKHQLKELQTIINDHAHETTLDAAALARENDCLRRQLQERDQLILQLRQQLAQLRPLPVT